MPAKINRNVSDFGVLPFAILVEIISRKLYLYMYQCQGIHKAFIVRIPKSLVKMCNIYQP